MTTAARLETRPEVLRGIADKLWDRYEQGHFLRPEELDALAEACFRLAVRADATPEEAVSLLVRAHRVDPVNPKHPYHIGLIHLRHGRVEAALEWLTAAAESAPANHRIWAHLSVVHRDLHDLREGDPDYEGEQRQRSAEIADAIRSGRDDLAPKPSDAPPPAISTSLLRPGECRWSGIQDINAGFELRRPTSKRARDMIAEALERIAGLAAPRRGGTAAFAILAVQWMVHGYPPATVRRLAGALPPGDGPARRMLDQVCELFEIDEESLPDRLAACLAEERLPDVLIALIHQRRLMWRPLRLPNLGAYTVARQFAEDDGHREAATHLEAMKSAARTLTGPPPKALSDVVAPDKPEATDERLAAFEGDADLIRRLRDRAAGLAKELRGTDLKDADSYARVRADHSLLTEIAKRLETTRVERLEQLQEFKTTTVSLTRPEQFDARLERCEKALQQAIGLKALIGRINTRLVSCQGEFVGRAPVPPSEGAVAIQTDLATVTPEPAAAMPATPPTQDVAPQPETVAAAVEAAERALADNAARACRTLDAYPPHLRRRSALVLLRSYLDGHLAETWHRMGRHVAARRHWHAMLAENPMSAAVLHNLAVAHTAADDLPSAAQTWSRYLEALYAEALLAGTPTRGAAERAEVHRVLSGSFGTEALCGRPPAEGVPDAPLRGVPAELTSPARAALAVAHLRLEELNRALSYRSPVLRLGVARSVRRPQLDQAFDARLDLAAAACAPLPERVRAPFDELCRAAFQSAYEAACDPAGRTREVTDPAEEEAHAAWARERIRWKERIAHELTAADDWPVTESSGEILASLRLIDGLRLDPRDEALRHAALRLGHGDPGRYLDRLNDLSDLAAQYAINEIFRAAEHRLDSSTDFPGRYRRICLSWQRNGVSDRYLELLDDPQAVYGPSVKPAIDRLNAAGGVPDAEILREVLAAMPVMEHWVARFRGASGPAARLGELLRVVGEEARARPLLTKARAAAFARDSPARARLAIECDDFTDAAARLRRLAEHRKQQHANSTDVRQLMIRVYERWAASDGPLPPVAQIRDDLGQWSHPENAHESRLRVVEVTVNRHRRRPGELDLESLATSLRQLWDEDGQNSFARYQLARLLYQHAVQVRTRMRATFGSSRDALRDELTRLCRECADHAAGLLDEAERLEPSDRYHVLADDVRRREIDAIFQRVRRYHS